MNKLLFTATFLTVTCLSGTALLGQSSDKSGSDKKASDTIFEPVSFESKDGLSISADLYKVHDATAPFIVLCHQAGWSRGEYREIAPKLNKLGFNCMAIDQRSGKGVNDVDNETFQRASDANKGVAYLDAEQDITAAIEWAKGNHAEGKLILWGSSYSAALSLKVAGDRADKIDGVLAFAPGEYFSRFGKPDDYVTSSAKNIEDPSFITSAKKEKKNWIGIHEAIPGDKKVMFLPETEGNHGSRALWEKFEDHKDYWNAVEEFLGQFK